MQLTVCAWDERIFNIEVDADETVENIKAILEAESGLPSAQQSLVAGGRPLEDASAKLSAVGVGAGDILMLFQPQPQQAGRGGGGGGGAAPGHAGGGLAQELVANPAMRRGPDGSAVSPAAFIAVVKGNARLLAALTSDHSPLGDAIMKEDLDALQRCLRAEHQQQVHAAQQAAEEDELAFADPFDMDAQRRIEERINKKNIEENYAAAWENSPEVFAQVQMLYVNLVINNVPVQAFVDSGAQITIMTEAFANKCHLGRLMDRRFKGVAVGVGSTPIIARVHQAPLQVAGHHTTTSITVLKAKDGPQFIFGLDMLRRHQCTVNLRDGRLEFGSCDAVLPFLGEADIPKEAEESTSQGAAAAEAGPSQGATSAPAHVTGGASTSASPAGAAGAAAAARAAGPAAAPPPAATPAAAAPPSAAAPPAAPAVGGADEAKVQLLMRMGFPREECVQALQATNGDADAAGAMLFSF